MHTTAVVALYMIYTQSTTLIVSNFVGLWEK